MALKLKSNNTQGNPYHDEEGKFTSKGGEGTGGSEKKSDPLMDLFGSLGKTMKDSESEEKEAMKMFGLNKTESNVKEPEEKQYTEHDFEIKNVEGVGPVVNFDDVEYAWEEETERYAGMTFRTGVVDAITDNYEMPFSELLEDIYYYTEISEDEYKSISEKLASGTLSENEIRGIIHKYMGELEANYGRSDTGFDYLGQRLIDEKGLD